MRKHFEEKETKGLEIWLGSSGNSSQMQGKNINIQIILPDFDSVIKLREN